MADEVGVVPPPPGVTPNFSHPRSLARQFTVINIVFPLLSTCVLMLRLYARHFIVRTISAEDSELLGWGLTAANFVCQSHMCGTGIHMWDVTRARFAIYLKTSIIGGDLFALAMLFLKLSFLLFYLRLSPIWQFRAGVYILMALVVGYSLVGALLPLYACRPMARFWDVDIISSSCVNFQALGIFYAALNSLTDLSLLFMPMWLLRNLPIPTSQKIGVLIIFMTGGFVSALSIVRLKVMLHSGETDNTWSSGVNILWLVIELNMGIVCACLPHLKSIQRRYLSKSGGGCSSTSNRGSTIRRISRCNGPPLNDRSQDEVSEGKEVANGELLSEGFGKPLVALKDEESQIYGRACRVD